MKSAGLRTVIVGFESFFPDELDSYGKGTDPSVNREAMRVLNSLGIDCYATVIIPPHWSREEFRECGAVMRDLGIHYVNLQPLTPLTATGSGITDDRLVLSRADFARWDLALVTVLPEKMSVAEFYREILALYSRTLFRPRFLWSYVPPLQCAPAVENGGGDAGRGPHQHKRSNIHDFRVEAIFMQPLLYGMKANGIHLIHRGNIDTIRVAQVGK